MTDTCDVAIVGGGVAGCAVAYYLSRSGVAATVVEREGIGSQASGYSAGGLNPLQGAGIPGPLGPLAMESFRLHLETWESLKSESGVDFTVSKPSMVRVAFDESGLTELQETLNIFEAAEGFSARWMEPEELYDLEPRIAPGAVRALYTHGNAALDSYLYTLALAGAAEANGATVRAAAVTGLRSQGRRVTGLLLDDGELSCGRVVMATGPWSGEVAEWLDVPIPVTPLKGEILRMRPAGDQPLAHDFASGDVSLYRRAECLVWVGATEESRGFDREPSRSALDALVAGAASLMPSMAEATLVRQTACLRPVTPDWLPIVGRAPGWDNVYLATGAGKKGVLVGPGMGKAVADLISEGSTALPITAFDPRRFAALH